MWQDSQTITILQFAVKILKCNQLCYFLLQKNQLLYCRFRKTDTLSEPGWQLVKQLGQKYIIRIISRGICPNKESKERHLWERQRELTRNRVQHEQRPFGGQKQNHV